jgi:nucleoside-diphosphate-sugar epimerase
MEKALLATSGMDVVINCAALTDGMGAYNPKTYIQPNIKINQNLIEAAFINKIKHFIFLSCTIMYPSSCHPLKEYEHDPDNVHTKYHLAARMKLSAEDLCRIYADLGNTKYTVVRHTNIYGPHDKFDLTKGHVLPATITKVMESDGQIIVWGKGEETRDFLYISDLIEFIDKAIERQENNFEIFNVGSGITYTVNQLVDTIIRCSRKNLKVIHDLTKPSIEACVNINVEKARQILKWNARINLVNGISQTIEWYKQDHPR